MVSRPSSSGSKASVGPKGRELILPVMLPKRLPAERAAAPPVIWPQAFAAVASPIAACAEVNVCAGARRGAAAERKAASRARVNREEGNGKAG